MFQDPSLKRRQENSNGTGYATDDQVIIGNDLHSILDHPCPSILLTNTVRIQIHVNP